MNTRRQFFGQIATMIAAASASSILLPKSIDKFTFKANDATKVAVFKTRKLKAVWTCEMEQDLHAMYGIKATEQLLDEYAKKYGMERPNEKVISIGWTPEPKVIDPQNWCFNRSILIKTKSYV